MKFYMVVSYPGTWLLFLALRPSHTAAITKMITITMQRERILLVELLHAEYAHGHSSKRMRSLRIVIILDIAAVGPGLLCGMLLG